MDKFYFLSKYEIDCYELSIERLTNLYPQISEEQLKQDKEQIRRILDG